MACNDNPQVFYAPAKDGYGPVCIDTAHDNGAGELVSMFRQKTQAELAFERGGEVLVTDMNTFLDSQEAHYKSEPKRIDQEDFTLALEALPPMQYGVHYGLETFRFMERLCGRITSIYAREPNGTCWKFNDLAHLSHEAVHAKITDRKFNRMRPSMARVLGLETRSAKEG